MNNSKLTRTLQTLNPAELKRLLQFLKSPFYNANPNIVNLYLLLRTYHPAFDSPKLAKEKAFKKLFPNRPYDHKKLLNLMSDFTALLEKYLTVLQLEKEELEQKKLLIRAYAGRPDCYAAFEKKVWELDGALDALPYRDEIYFFEKKELNLLYYGHPDTSKTLDKKNTLQIAIDNFGAYKKFVDIKLKCASNAVANTFRSKKTTAEIGGNILFKNPLFILYKKLELFQRTKEASNLNELINYFIEHISLLRNDDREYILKMLLNSTNRKINEGKTEFIPVSFELYKTGLQNDCLISFGKMTENTFQNIVTGGTKCREFEWTKKFIKTYKSTLDTIVREDTIAISLAQLHFEKKEFNISIEVLNHNFQNSFIRLKSKAMMVRAWFELFCKEESYSELVLAQLDAFEKYVRRDKTLTIKLSSAYLKFISITKKLVNKRWERNFIFELEKEIKKEANLVLKGWLLEKVSLYQKKKGLP